MGIRSVVLIPKKKKQDISLYDLAVLLDLHERSVSDFPCEMKSKDAVTWIDFDECIKYLTTELINCINEPEECEPYTRRSIMRDLEFLLKYERVMRENDVVIVWDDRDTVCEYHRKGYIPITYLLIEQFRETDEKWIEELCG